MTSSAVRAAVDVHGVSVVERASAVEFAQHRVQIGVMPLPAEMNSIFSGSGSGSVNSPSTSPRKTCRPGCTSRVKTGDIRPPSVCFTVTLTTPSGWPGSDVIVYARQCRMPLISIPIRRYCPGTCGGHAKSGLITTSRRRRVSWRTRTTSPVSSRVDQRGLIRAR